jgi:hypothetical protein
MALGYGEHPCGSFHENKGRKPMNGNYNLDTATITRLVTRTSPGAYILSRVKNPASGKWNADYVGRSDDDLAGRLKSHAAAGKYSMFWFDYTTGTCGAYELECTWWHQYQPRDNQIHPATPANGNCKCPVAGCTYRAAVAR